MRGGALRRASIKRLQATAGRPKIWIPVLGKGQKAQLGHIYDSVLQNQICPAVPSQNLIGWIAPRFDNGLKDHDGTLDHRQQRSEERLSW
jgi:hypothetical protein